MMKKLMALDGNNLLFRAFYALPPMVSAQGVHTNAIYGFLGMLIRLLSDHTPDYLVVAFDMHGPTFRHEQFTQYKAGRKATPEELSPQFALLKQLLAEMGVAVLETQGFEADDILGTLGKAAGKQGMQALLVSGDRDIFQVIDEQVSVLYANRGVSDVEILDAEALYTRFGYTPEQVPTLKSLMGDASDNIPGIPGVGEKTALSLLAHFSDLEEILEHPEQVLKGAMLKKVQNGKESARLSLQLATIDCNAPVDLTFSHFVAPDLYTEQVYTAIGKLGMTSLIERLRRASPLAQNVQEIAIQRSEFAPLVMLRSEDQVRSALQSLPKGPLALTLWPQIELAAQGMQMRFCIQEDLLSAGLQPDQVYAFLGEALKDHNVYFYDGKAAFAELSRHGVALPEVAGDAMIAGYLLFLQEGASTCKQLSKRVFEVEEEGAAILWDLTQYLHSRIDSDGMHELYYEVELPLTHVLYDMEQVGFTIDTLALQALGKTYDTQMDEIRAKIYELAGTEFNILSPKQLGIVLFETLGLPAVKKTKSGYSTDSSVLEQLDHPIAQSVLDYRALSKLKGTYVDGLLGLVGKDGRVHTTFHQTITATGRISSAEPNLQNIPIRTAQGRVIRSVFLPSSSANRLIDADYSQIELRVLAHMSGDPTMQEAYHLGQDIHVKTASEVFGVPIDQVTQKLRSSAKAINFGVVYGISDFGLARNTGITRTEAKAFIEMYFARYPKVRAYMDACIIMGKTQGYVATLMGRRRYLPELSSANYNIRSFGERAAMNTPIQGTAADIIKLAMVRVWRALKAGGYKASLILQVHDELIIDAPVEEVEQVMKLLQHEMEQAMQLSVPIDVDVHSGISWDDAK